MIKEINKIKIIILSTKVTLPHILTDHAQGKDFKVMLTPVGEVSEDFGNSMISNNPDLFALYDPNSADQKKLLNFNWNWRPDYLKEDAMKDFIELDPKDREVAHAFLEILKKGKSGILLLKGNDVKVYKELMKNAEVKKLVKGIKAGLGDDTGDGDDGNDDTNENIIEDTDGLKKDDIEKKMKDMYLKAGYKGDIFKISKDTFEGIKTGAIAQLKAKL